ncbi:dihydrodipicolinate synthase family protein [Arthrobacter pityocampae]|uniref:Dihydrodipicolinate synthase family protein n=1 Tax=Arthrobacter pityocampae TaxID=547334 RepID=A0A2S5IZK5_9MICC|nr:dihydrodipicolinate synthase family protein [Arthrobacter pityocampae]PPB50026.1 dihydrodipicolinate synthase family protein [Arthrobacter pityocampae]
MDFTGLIAYPLTPFLPDGAVATADLRGLAEGLASSAVDAVAVLGSSGSFAYLDRAERARVARTVIDAVDGRLPVAVGISSVGTREVLEAATDAQEAGAAGLVLSPVSYVPLTDDEVLAQVRAVDEATDLPICLYNNPGTTQFDYSLQVVAELSSLPDVVAFKDTAADAVTFNARHAELARLVSAPFSHGVSGDRLMMTGEVAADAWHSGPAALLPAYYARLRAAVVAGDRTEAERVRRVLAPLVDHVAGLRSISGLHLLARACGVSAGDPRPPLLPSPGSELRELGRLLDVLEAAFDDA